VFVEYARCAVQYGEAVATVHVGHGSWGAHAVVFGTEWYTANAWVRKPGWLCGPQSVVGSVDATGQAVQTATDQHPPGIVGCRSSDRRDGFGVMGESHG
jgi:hypothetical protein